MRVSCLAIAFALVGIASARAEGGDSCAACRPEDETQAGDYTPPPIPPVQKPTHADPRGVAVQLPLPGDPVVHHRPGAGLWLGEVGEGNNVFLKPQRDRLSVGVKRDF